MFCDARASRVSMETIQDGSQIKGSNFLVLFLNFIATNMFNMFYIIFLNSIWVMGNPFVLYKPKYSQVTVILNILPVLKCRKKKNSRCSGRKVSGKVQLSFKTWSRVMIFQIMIAK